MKILFTLLSILCILSSDYSEPQLHTIYFESNTPLNRKQINELSKLVKAQKISKFYSSNDGYWQYYFEVETLNVKKSSHLLKNSPLVAKVEKPLPVNLLSLEPRAESKQEAEDSFYAYQWGLENRGQKIYRDTDDIHPMIVESKTGSDIGWKDLQAQIKESNLKSVIVAVIDSGLSTSHPDIKNQLYKIESECKFGNIIPGSQEDHNNNGYKGDCIGWNFTTRDRRTQNDVLDDIGHGTHVSGIIAATIHNSEGISGITNNVRLMPLKVYKESRAANDSTNAFVQRVAKAILYAADNGAQVINLSLGWPLASHNQVIKEALDYALEKNITIVAGAGNDSHNARVYPCSYEGVICVGSTGIDHTYADFSNYGGYVDVLAPGENIVSTWPVSLFAQNFGQIRYEILSGTSQSAPHISGAVAVLKGLYPEITNKEIRARLFLSSQEVADSKKSSLHGLAKLDQMLKINKTSYLVPNFKKIDSVEIDPSNKVHFPLEIENLWDKANNVQVSISSDNLSLDKSSFSLNSISAGATAKINLSGKILDLSKSNRISLHVSIISNEQNNSFQHSIIIQQPAEIKTQKQVFIESKDALRTVYNLSSANQEEYYSIEKVEGGLNIHLYIINGNQAEKLSFYKENATRIYPNFGFVAMDIDKDGKRDYLINSVVQNGEEIHIEQDILNDQFVKKYPHENSFQLIDEGLFYDPRSIELASYKSSLGEIQIPYFKGGGTIPKKDQNPDPFERLTSIESGIYTLAPECDRQNCFLQTRLLTNYQFDQILRKKLSIRFNEEIKYLYFQAKQDKIELFITYGLGIRLQFARIELTAFQPETMLVENISLPPLDLRFHRSQKINDKLIAFYGLYTQTEGRVVLMNTDNWSHKIYKFSSKSISNPIVAVLKVFLENDQLKAFAESRDSLQLFTWQKDQKQASVQESAIFRFSYLPGNYFTDSLYPIRLKNQQWAILTDASQMHNRSVYAWTATDGLISSIDKTFKMPQNCRLMNPYKGVDHDILVLQCKKQDGFELQFLSL